MGQPLHQTGLGARQIDARDPYLGESEFPGQGLNTSNEWMADDHLPIVETKKTQKASRTLHWRSEDDTAAFARALAAAPVLRDAFVALHGDLGAGKTTFVRHLLRALGVHGRIKSPTYAVVEPYVLPDGTEVSHFDFYRFEDPREWEDAGFRDIFAGPGLKLAEWPEKAAGLLPVCDLRLDLQVDIETEARSVAAQALSPHGEALLR